MTNTTIRAGGAPVQSTVLVSVDGTTIQGNGSAQNPLRAVGQSVPSLNRENAPGGVVHVDVDGTTPLTILTGTLGAGAVFYQFDLADGEEDGFQKTLAIQPTPNGGASFRVFASFMSDGAYYQRFGFTNVGGGLVLVWSAADACWLVVSTYNGVAA